MKRKRMYIVISLMVLFGIYNVIWYTCSYQIIEKYEKEFEEVADSGEKLYIDAEGCQYSVKTPGYLLWDGNLAIVDEENKQAMIIWIEHGGKKVTTGIVVQSEPGIWIQMEMLDQKTAAESDRQEIADRYQQDIARLYAKAYETWGLEIE